MVSCSIQPSCHLPCALPEWWLPGICDYTINGIACWAQPVVPQIIFPTQDTVYRSNLAPSPWCYCRRCYGPPDNSEHCTQVSPVLKCILSRARGLYWWLIQFKWSMRVSNSRFWRSTRISFSLFHACFLLYKSFILCNIRIVEFLFTFHFFILLVAQVLLLIQISFRVLIVMFFVFSVWWRLVVIGLRR